MSPAASEGDIKPEIMPFSPSYQIYNDLMHFDSSDSLPKLHTDSSCSEHVPSPEFTCEREVQSEPKLKLSDWEESALDFPFNYTDATTTTSLFGSSPFQSCYEMSPLQDIFMYLQKPF